MTARVAAGGHDVPGERLAGRYERLWPQVVIAVPHCRRAVSYDNSTDDGPIERVAYRRGIADAPARWPAWTPDALLLL